MAETATSLGCRHLVMVVFANLILLEMALFFQATREQRLISAQTLFTSEGLTQ